MQKKQLRPTGNSAGQDRVFVDTSAWIAFFSTRDQNHAEAERLFREAVARSALLMTTNLVLAEVHRLILHRVGIGAAAFALDRIESSKRVSIAFATGTHHAAARAWLARLSDHRITYADATSFAVMEDIGCTGYLSFDSDFLRAGFRPWASA